MNNEFQNNEAVEKMLTEILCCPEIVWTEDRVNNSKTIMSIVTPDGSHTIMLTKIDDPGAKGSQVNIVFKHNVGTDIFYEETLLCDRKIKLIPSKKRLRDACVAVFETFHANKLEAVLNILQQFLPTADHKQAIANTISKESNCA